MEEAMNLLSTNIESPYSIACYIIAGCIAVYGFGSAAMKVVGDDHHTMRDLIPGITRSALAAGAMMLIGANISVFMN